MISALACCTASGLPADSLSNTGPQHLGAPGNAFSFFFFLQAVGQSYMGLLKGG